ncbi:cysteine desulfurase NifS, partial [Candidatus Pacearchaeota archaeon]|nr:cysteine desulfurase NifS [Candidatus Pacearchaeota archaeon]
RGLRSGTENVAGAIGFAAALKETKIINVERVQLLRDKLLDGLESLGGRLVGSRDERLWNIATVVFADRDGEDVVMRLSEKGVMCGTGSACSSRKEDDRVLGALGLSEKEAGGVVRFSLGAEHTGEDIDFVLKEVREILSDLKDSVRY